MKKYIFATVLGCFLTCFIHAQTLNNREVFMLSMLFGEYIEKQDTAYDPNRVTEFVYIIVTTDSTGQISNIRAQGCDSDSLFRVLCKLTPNELTVWKFPNAKKKTIVFPLFRISDGPRVFADSVLRGFDQIPNEHMVTEYGNLVLVSRVVLWAPFKPKE